MMATTGERLMLSALKTDLPSSMNNNVSQKRCLIHVKLTEFCMKTVEHLIDSEKGAYFSLWFDENGGRMSIPVEHGDARIFHFKTAPLREGEGQGSLECVHQAIATHSPQEHLLSCWGVMEHRLTVQGTDEVYVRTKKQMEIAEKLRKEQRTQEIKVPQGRPKAKALQPVERVSPVPATFRKPNRPKLPPPSFSKSAGNKGLLQVKPHNTPPKHIAVSDTKPKPSSRSTHSLKDRVIHMLALKPHTRENIVNKLKKATKRSETAMSNLDSILEEVSEVTQGAYRLKSHYLRSLDVDQWPFYTDAQKQMLKRSKCVGGTLETAQEVMAASKRSDDEIPYETAPKKLKLSEYTAEAGSTKEFQDNDRDAVPIAVHVKPVDVPKAVESPVWVHCGDASYGDGSYGDGSYGDSTAQTEKEHVTNTSSHRSSKDKVQKKKKKKKKRDDTEVVNTDPTSTTSTPDHLSQFPTLTCEEERQRYKQIFNREYVDYLQLKESIDQVADQNQKECSALSERLDSVPKHSEEYKEVKKLIQEKYKEFQSNRSYLENKNKFDELHQKLNHIKQMVLQYDAKHRI